MNSIIIITILAVVLLFLGVYKKTSILLPVAVIGLLAALASQIATWNTNLYYFNQMVLFDNFSIVFSSLTIITTILIIILSKGYFEKISNDIAEYLALILFALVGVLCMVSFQNLTMLFIGIEIMSISMYALAGIRKKDLASNEAALKYFLMGSFATAFLMFGIALIYGFTGTFNLDQIAAAVGMSNGVIAPLFYTGILFILVGMLFKISAAPFHFWAPDVYEGAPSLITLFMSTVVKTASFAAFIRLFITCFASLATYLTPTLWIIALLTITIGNLSALKQHSFKRMLAYSSISQAGYMLLAILAIGPNSSKAIFLYASAYSIASITAFAIFIKVKEMVKSDSFEAFNGLGKRNPGMALALTIAMCSLAGIPLTAGFFGKFYIFTNAMAQNYYGLVILAILNAVIGVWYYFKVIIAMYMKQSIDNSPIDARGNMALVLFITTMATIILGIFPSILSSLF